MWLETTEATSTFVPSNNNPIKEDQVIQQEQQYDRYSEDDNTTTDTGSKTFSSVADSHQYQQHDSPPFTAMESNNEIEYFENLMNNVENGQVSRYQNTYFMDGGNRFISLPTLGNTSTKAAGHISRVFEDWLQNKLYHQTNFDRLPILEDSVELLAEDVVNKLKTRTSVRGLTGLSRILIKIRTGHVYTYHQYEQPLITADMEDFFQQFPLFVEIIIYTMPKEEDMYDVELLLAVENVTVNPGDPYYIKQDIPLIA